MDLDLEVLKQQLSVLCRNDYTKLEESLRLTSHEIKETMSGFGRDILFLC